jgi:hypothetical protein
LRTENHPQSVEFMLKGMDLFSDWQTGWYRKCLQRDLNHTLFRRAGRMSPLSLSGWNSCGSNHLMLVNYPSHPGNGRRLDLPMVFSENKDAYVFLHVWHLRVGIKLFKIKSHAGKIWMVSGYLQSESAGLSPSGDDNQSDGSDYQILAQGNSASLSPNNRQICFSHDSDYSEWTWNRFVVPLDGTLKTTVIPFVSVVPNVLSHETPLPG